MHVVAKAAPKYAELLDRVNKGFHYLELQLLNDGIEQALDNIKRAKEDLEEKAKVQGFDILSVHTPLIQPSELNSRQDISIEYLTEKTQYKSFESTLKIAQTLAESQGHTVNVVVHNGLSAEQYRFIPVLCDELAYIFDELFCTYDKVKVLIENVTPITSSDYKCNGVYVSDGAYIAEYLNKAVQKDKFALTFDTCHWIMTKNDYYNTLDASERTKLEDFELRDFSFDTVFKQFSNYIQNIHLNSLIGFGDINGKHGTKLTEQDKFWLDELFDAYSKYNCKALITLEIAEENYLNTKDLTESYEIIADKLNELNITR